MPMQDEIRIEVDLQKSIEIDLGEGKDKKRRRQRQDDYDYADPLIEPFEEETKLVSLECSIEDFFVYKGQLPYSAKRVLSVHRAREARAGAREIEVKRQKEINRLDFPKEARDALDPSSEDTGASKLSPQKKAALARTPIPKSEEKNCAPLISFIVSRLRKPREEMPSGDDKLEYYAHCLVLKQVGDPLYQELSPPPEMPTEEETMEYVERNRKKEEELMKLIVDDIHDHRLYAENFTLFRGFRRAEFNSRMLGYMLCAIRVEYLTNDRASFSKLRKDVLDRIRPSFSDVCRNTCKMSNYLNQYITALLLEEERSKGDGGAGEDAMREDRDDGGRTAPAPTATHSGDSSADAHSQGRMAEEEGALALHSTDAQASNEGKKGSGHAEENVP
jgi:hypothetical protein